MIARHATQAIAFGWKPGFTLQEDIIGLRNVHLCTVHNWSAGDYNAVLTKGPATHDVYWRTLYTMSHQQSFVFTTALRITTIQSSILPAGRSAVVENPRDAPYYLEIRKKYIKNWINVTLQMHILSRYTAFSTWFWMLLNDLDQTFKVTWISISK